MTAKLATVDDCILAHVEEDSALRDLMLIYFLDRLIVVFGLIVFGL